MKITKLQRTFKEGLNNFYRNGWLSFATVSILAISLYIISVTVILGLAASIVSKDVQNKINVSVYFNSDVQESKIQEIKNKLIGYKEIKSIEFVSKDQALDQLKKTIPNKDIILMDHCIIFLRLNLMPMAICITPQRLSYRTMFLV